MRDRAAGEALQEWLHHRPVHALARPPAARHRHDQGAVGLLRDPGDRIGQDGRAPRRHRHHARPRLHPRPQRPREGCDDDRRRRRRGGLLARRGEQHPARLEEGEAADRQLAWRARLPHLAQGPSQEPRLPDGLQGPRQQAPPRRRVDPHARLRQGAPQAARRAGRQRRCHRFVAGQLDLPEVDDRVHQIDVRRRGPDHRGQRRHDRAGAQSHLVGRRRAARRDGLRLHLHDAGGDGLRPATGDGGVPGGAVRAHAGRAGHRRRRHLQRRQDLQGARRRRVVHHDGLHARGHRGVAWRIFLQGRDPAEAVPRHGLARRDELGRRLRRPLLFGERQGAGRAGRRGQRCG
mmetsp:Transcript_14384/g.44897  ORF Transcript_14384/g.44897 Transcript_14384/m.44897 type:complete len:348 (-) Transcript_14384:18-1061(-)